MDHASNPAAFHSKKQISIIVPVYNEEQSLQQLYDELYSKCETLPYEFEFLFVNDGSSDNSQEKLIELAVKDSRVVPIELARNVGKEIALTAGINNCSGDAAIIMYADLQHPPEYIPQFIEKWEAGSLVVVGRRKDPEDRSLFRSLSTKLFYFAINYTATVKISPSIMDFRLIDREVIDHFNRFTERNRITRGLIDWLGYPQTFIDIKIPERAHGESTYSTLKLFKLAKDSLVSMSLLPLKVSGYLGIAIIVVFGPLGIFVLIDQAFLGDNLEVSGSGSLAILTAFMIGVVLTNLGLIALYIANMHDESLSRPLYIQKRLRPPTKPPNVDAMRKIVNSLAQETSTAASVKDVLHEFHYEDIPTKSKLRIDDERTTLESDSVRPEAAQRAVSKNDEDLSPTHSDYSTDVNDDTTRFTLESDSVRSGVAQQTKNRGITSSALEPVSSQQRSTEQDVSKYGDASTGVGGAEMAEKLVEPSAVQKGRQAGAGRVIWFSWQDISHPKAGGAELLTTNLRERLVQDGHEVTLLTGSYPGAKKEEFVNGVRIIRMGGRYTVHFRVMLYYLFNKKKLFTDEARSSALESASSQQRSTQEDVLKYDDANTGSVGAEMTERLAESSAAQESRQAGAEFVAIDESNTAPFFFRWYSRRPTMMFFHQLTREIWFHESPQPISTLGYLAEELYIRLLNNQPAITVSRSSRLDLLKRGFHYDNISIISEGIRITPVDNPSVIQKFSKPTVLALGAVRSMKQSLHQIEAFETAKSALPNLQLIIAGDIETTSYARRVKEHIESSEYAQDIEVMGKVSEELKVELLQKSHWLLVTSIKEGWCLVVTEAASQGTPAIVYDADGLRDSVKNGETGFVVHPTPEAMAETIIEAFEHAHSLEFLSGTTNDLVPYPNIQVAQHGPGHKDYSEMQWNAWRFAKTITFKQSYTDFKKSTGL